MKQIFIALLVLLILPFGVNAEKIKKSNIKVLIVTHNPSKVFTARYSGPKPTAYHDKLARTRGKEFKDLLDKYFNTVVIVNSEEYKCEMSDDYDVTIMDALPKPIEEVDFGMYLTGKSVMRGDKPMMYNRYLTEDYDRATIAIGALTDNLTYIYSTKLMTQ